MLHLESKFIFYKTEWEGFVCFVELLQTFLLLQLFPLGSLIPQRYRAMNKGWKKGDISPYLLKPQQAHGCLKQEGEREANMKTERTQIERR